MYILKMHYFLELFYEIDPRIMNANIRFFIRLELQMQCNIFTIFFHEFDIYVRADPGSPLGWIVRLVLRTSIVVHLSKMQHRQHNLNTQSLGTEGF